MPARYRVDVSPQASRELAAFPKKDQQRIVDRIAALADDPRPATSKKLAGEHGLYRIRSGDYRIVYTVNDGGLLVLVVRIGHRREVYRKKR